MTTTATREKPIIFSAPMVQAILAGRKTQTRRICKSEPLVASFADAPMAKARGPEGASPHGIWTDEERDYFVSTFCPYGNPGDRLWVRETWQRLSNGSGDAEYEKAMENVADCFYRADESDPESRPMSGRWRSPIHMPRWASRLTLEITDVRVERVQSISAKDIIAEGAVLRPHVDQFGRNPVSAFDGGCYMDLRSLWAAGWDKLHGPGAWNRNDWVWALSFKVLP